MARRKADKPDTVTLDELPLELQVPHDVARRMDALRPRLESAQEVIARGERPLDSAKREEMYVQRQAQKRGHVTMTEVDGRERIIGLDDILSIRFLARGLLASRSVARVEIPALSHFGTGFLVSPDLMMTNNHVLPSKIVAGQAQVCFEMFDPLGRLTDCRELRLDPERFFFTDPVLDVTVVGLLDTAETREGTADLGWHPMISQQGKIRVGDPVNILQHPGGRSKSIVVHNSNLLHLEDGPGPEDPAMVDAAKLRDPFLWYSSDTERGSSGAPVFNCNWEVVGVHHRSVPKTNARGELLASDGSPIDRAAFTANPDLALWVANEGTRTSRIVAALGRAEFERALETQLRDRLLVLWEESRGHNHGIEAGARAAPPATRRADATLLTEAAQGLVVQPAAGGAFTVQITVRPG